MIRPILGFSLGLRRTFAAMQQIYVAHVDRAAGRRPRERDRRDHLCDARVDLRHAAAGRRADLAVGLDPELHGDGAGELRVGEELVLVAGLDLPELAVDRGADLVLVAPRVRIAGGDRGLGAAAVADRAVAAGADRAPAGVAVLPGEAGVDVGVVEARGDVAG